MAADAAIKIIFRIDTLVRLGKAVTPTRTHRIIRPQRIATA
jgi:hypothetical protein